MSVGDVGSGISREDYIDQVATDVLGKLPEEFDLDKVRKKFGLDISPTTVVLLQELERFNCLITRMKRSLTTIRKVSHSFLGPSLIYWHVNSSLNGKFLHFDNRFHLLEQGKLYNSEFGFFIFFDLVASLNSSLFR